MLRNYISAKQVTIMYTTIVYTTAYTSYCGMVVYTTAYTIYSIQYIVCTIVQLLQHCALYYSVHTLLYFVITGDSEAFQPLVTLLGTTGQGMTFQRLGGTFP